MRWPAVLCGASLLVGCSRRSEPAPTLAVVVAEPVTSAPAARALTAPYVFRGQPTSALPLSADTARRVEALIATEKEMRGDEDVKDGDSDARLWRLPHYETAHRGLSDEPSRLHAVAEDLLDHSERDEFRALLTHESVVVRAYVGPHVLWRHPTLLDDAAALLTDETPLCVPSKCFAREVTLGRWMSETLCELHFPAARQLRQRVSQGQGEVAKHALSCLAKPADKVLFGLIPELLPETTRPDFRRTFESTLQNGAMWQDLCPSLLALSSEGTPGVWNLATSALMMCSSEDAQQRWSRHVREATMVDERLGDVLLGLLAYPGTSSEFHRQLLSDWGRIALMSLHLQTLEDSLPASADRLTQLLPTIVTLAVASPRLLTQPVARLPESPELWPALQRIANQAQSAGGKRSAKTVAWERLTAHSRKPTAR